MAARSENKAKRHDALEARGRLRSEQTASCRRRGRPGSRAHAADPTREQGWLSWAHAASPAGSQFAPSDSVRLCAARVGRYRREWRQTPPFIETKSLGYYPTAIPLRGMTTTVFLAAVCSDPAAVNSLKPRLRVSHSFGSTRPRRDWRRRRDARTVGLIPQSRRPGSCGAIKVPPRPQPLARTQDPSPSHWPFPPTRPPPKLHAAPDPCDVL